MNSYYLCNKTVVDFLSPEYVSSPFKSGYDHDKGDNYFVALISDEDFDTLKAHYSKIDEDAKYEFEMAKLVPGYVSADGLTISDMRRNGVFNQIEFMTGLTKFSNRAMVLMNFSQQLGVSPIELINRIVKVKKLNT